MSASKLKIELNLGKAIRRGTQICLDKAEPIWIPVKYERLPSFCYCCGRLGHTIVECDSVDNMKETNAENTTELRFGEYLRASPIKNAKVVVDAGARSNHGSNSTLWYSAESRNKVQKEEDLGNQKMKSKNQETKEKIDEIALNLGRVMVNADSSKGISTKENNNKVFAHKLQEVSEHYLLPIAQNPCPKPNLHTPPLPAQPQTLIQDKILNPTANLIPISELVNLCYPHQKK